MQTQRPSIFQNGALRIDPERGPAFRQIWSFMRRHAAADRHTEADVARHTIRLCREFRTWRREQRL